MHKPSMASLVLAATVLGAPSAARAQKSDEIQILRQEVQALRAAYEARLQALEQRLKAAEAVAAAPVAPLAPVAPVAPAAPALQAVAPQPPAAPVAAPAGANAFNPALSLILSGTYANTSQDPRHYGITGLLLPGSADAGPGTRGFSLGESELGLSASIDPWWRGAAHFALAPDDSVSVEEAYVQTTALGRGLSLKLGRFFSGIGYLNAQHAHTWDFVDNPLAYQALLGTQLGDDGVQLRWLAPTDQYIEVGVELARGRAAPGGDNSRNGAGMKALHLHTGGDIGESQNWRAGLSVLQAQASEQQLLGRDAAGGDVDAAFSGRTRVWVADAVWKWAPGGNATRTSVKLQGEYLRSKRSGKLLADPTAAPADYRATTSGWYVQGIYQFLPGWRVGLRTEGLRTQAPGAGQDGGLLLDTGYRPRKHSLMLDYSASEFSRLRLQLAQDRSRAGASDSQVFLQYQMSLGAHGAHGY